MKTNDRLDATQRTREWLEHCIPVELTIEERIGRRAYAIYEERQRTCQDGSPEGDWYQAMADLESD